MVRLSPEETHHLVDVLRVRPGEQVELFDGQGREAVAAYQGCEAGGAVLKVLSAVNRSALPKVTISLFQALAKGKRMDWIIEKAVELGAARIVPVAAERCVVRLNRTQAEARVGRWRKIAASAARQCHVAHIPEVSLLASMDAAIAAASASDLFLVGALTRDAVNLMDVLADVRRGCIASLALLIGPEGDFTEAEVSRAVAAGARPVSFGSRVLRVETAAVYGLSVAAYEFLNGPVRSAGAACGCQPQE